MERSTCVRRALAVFFGMLALLFAAVGPVLAAEAVATPPALYGSDPAHGKTLVINGIDLYYESYGDGPPLLLIHGNGQSIKEMDKQIAFFARKWRVIVVDSRGHGKSGLGAGRLTYDQMAEDMNVLLDRLDIPTANVLGWSDGGNIGLILAIKHPEKVGKLATMGALIAPEGAYGWAQDWVKAQVTAMNTKIAAGDSSQDWPKYLQLLDLLGKQPQVAVTDLSKITAPTLVMAADKDVIRADHTQQIFEGIPKAQLVIFPGATHFIPAENAPLFNQTVETFFDTPFARPDTRNMFR